MRFLVNSAEAPVLVLASPLQFALNLVDLCSFGCSHDEFAGDDDEQHFNQRIRRNVRQLSIHRAPPSRAKDQFDTSYVHSGCQTRAHPDGSKPLQISGRDKSRTGAACRHCGSDAMRAGSS
jgi:hypothetical protein